MNRYFALIAITIVFFFSGCITTGFGPQGLLFTDTTIGVYGNTIGGLRHGKSCSSSVLGLYAWGDASVETAIRNGNIQKVRMIDYRGKSYFLFYSELCVIVQGD